MTKKPAVLVLAILLIILTIPLAASAAGDGNITVYVTITDNGGFYTGENNLEPLIAYPSLFRETRLSTMC